MKLAGGVALVALLMSVPTTLFASSASANGTAQLCTTVGSQSSCATPKTNNRIQHAGATSLNWAGNVDHNLGYTDAEATWKVPKASGGSGAYSSMWVGVGLGNSARYPLVQAGSESDGNGHTYAWLEIYPQEAEIPLPEMNVHPGDTLAVHVTFGAGGGTAAFHLVNKTRNIDRHYGQNYAGTYPDGHAEFIAERPCIGGVLPNLANFGKATFTGAQVAAGGHWYPVGTASHYYYSMVGYSGRTMAVPGAISSNHLNFPVTWKAAS
jgi:hypothetical protein